MWPRALALTVDLSMVSSHTTDHRHQHSPPWTPSWASLIAHTTDIHMALGSNPDHTSTWPPAAATDIDTASGGSPDHRHPHDLQGGNRISDTWIKQNHGCQHGSWWQHRPGMSTQSRAAAQVTQINMDLEHQHGLEWQHQ